MSDVGRPSKFTPKVREEILYAISKHVPYAIAAPAAGIGERTLYEWLELGEEHRDQGIESDYAEFAQAIKAIEQKKIIDHTEAVEQCPERWQAKGWLLERRWWQHFSNNAPLVEFKKQLDEMKSMIEKGQTHG
jgi:hypothetical protein